MTKRMLIDATHAEETRVVVLDGNRLEDFDVETSTKKQLKGNIYLAKIVRVEPSLQAAFVEYGGGRHGFLAFGEIHPDYYQIPVADRQRLLALQAEEAREEEDDEDDEIAPPPPRAPSPPHRSVRDAPAEAQPMAAASEPAGWNEPARAPADQAPDHVPPDRPIPYEPIAARPVVNEPVVATDDHPEPAPEAAAPATHQTDPAPAEVSGDIPSDASPATASDASPATASDASPATASYASPDTAADPSASPTELPPATAAGPAGEADGERDPGATPRAQPAAIPEQVTYGDVTYGDADRHPGAAQSGIGARSADNGAFDGMVGDSPRPISRERDDADDDDQAPELPPPETIGGETDAVDEMRSRRTARFLRNYRIQEVIRRRQIMLVQVVKEERGTKGAALTTYISLAGRFCVLMPNSPRGGGISRKITSAADRKRLKEITAELDIPQGMGLIVRTAGANRPKPEIKRDCEYLMRLWDDIREHTLRSVAPALIYEEASLIKRAIRDVYSRDIDEIVVDGEEGWRAAHDFMRMLMPSHARKVQLWRPAAGDGAGQPLFSKHQVEAQLDSMLSPTVQLKSGGYLVINQAEALVAIDVNSGRSTRERGIEETAVRTNLEAADEVARQLRLRDLAGLIVIDFIDMESKKNNASVERRLKDALKIDRARIQVGHISHFGLLEMSRQRLRPSLAETSFVACPHCGGLGHVRSIESSALHVLRAIEDEGAKGRASLIQVFVATAIIMYVLNHKRERLAEIEARSCMRVQFAADEQLVPPALRIERLRAALLESERPVPVAPTPPEPVADVTGPDLVEADDLVFEPDEIEAPAVAEASEATAAATSVESREDGNRRRRRRRRRRPGRDANGSALGSTEEAGGDDSDEDDDEPFAAAELAEQPDIPRGAFPVVPEPVEQPVVPALIAQAAPVALKGPDEAAEATPVTEPAIPAEDATAEADGEEGDQARRRRGRRGGRRRRRDGSDAPAEATDAPQLPVWTGPTPADPFGGQTYDIFDLIEQQEQATPHAAAPSPEPAGIIARVADAPAEDEPTAPASLVPPSSAPSPAEPAVAATPPEAGAAVVPEGPAAPHGAAPALAEREPPAGAGPGQAVPPAEPLPPVAETAPPEAPVPEAPVAAAPVPEAPVSEAPVAAAAAANAGVKDTVVADTGAPPAPEPDPSPVTPSPAAKAIGPGPDTDAATTARSAPEPAKPSEERVEPVIGQPVKPLLVGQDEIPAGERKRGWWRR